VTQVGESMNTIRCKRCQHENPPDFSSCRQCGAVLVETGFLSHSEADNDHLAKANPPMQSHEKQISDETQKMRDESLPQTGEEWLKALENHRSDTTMEAPAIDSDAILQAQAEEDRRKTEELPDVDDEDSVLRIGSVRFRGDLVLKHQEGSADYVIKNDALQEVVIGRLDRVTGFSPTVDLTDLGGKAKGVSRRHATISIRGDLLVITDHNSMNGTFLNGQRLVPEQARVLRDTDVLRIGRINLLIHFRDY
jgi:pSer/pThr/pTyr-binding forkhead associated (FHA) protein